ncbi:flagellar hook-basal body complex protein FliE [Nocardioides bruguierae]|uniref:Flagellar hook-basal body complex protein FliE n=1 Tax=Nocardioides bruguierae TaxID=2945102 RepID=A0A9X2IH06_9ACTN|nr:flagellar hook-basal body complex protein FliE [Nocardioides bruguierae]MCM0622568.1 flagellar hook-basal body complex protein FliE [Nocardioides bruguierae]
MSVSGIEAIGATQFTPYLPPSVPTEMLGTVTDLGTGSSASSTSGAGGIAALLGEMGLSGAALAQPAGLGSLGSATSGATGAAGVSGVSSVSGAGAASGDFGSMVLGSIDSLDGLQKTADQLAVQAATGDLENLHDYTIAATQASVATQVTVAVRNKAVEAFTEIMRMPI